MRQTLLLCPILGQHHRNSDALPWPKGNSLSFADLSPHGHHKQQDVEAHAADAANVDLADAATSTFVASGQTWMWQMRPNVAETRRCPKKKMGTHSVIPRFTTSQSISSGLGSLLNSLKQGTLGVGPLAAPAQALDAMFALATKHRCSWHELVFHTDTQVYAQLKHDCASSTGTTKYLESRMSRKEGYWTMKTCRFSLICVSCRSLRAKCSPERGLSTQRLGQGVAGPRALPEARPALHLCRGVKCSLGF